MTNTCFGVAMLSARAGLSCRECRIAGQDPHTANAPTGKHVGGIMHPQVNPAETDHGDDEGCKPQKKNSRIVRRALRSEQNRSRKIGCARKRRMPAGKSGTEDARRLQYRVGPRAVEDELQEVV